MFLLIRAQRLSAGFSKTAAGVFEIASTVKVDMGECRLVVGLFIGGGRFRLGVIRAGSSNSKYKSLQGLGRFRLVIVVFSISIRFGGQRANE